MPFGVLSSLCNYEVTRRIREIILGVNPTYIPGCFLWLDAADTSTITAPGGNVTQWNDKSGFGYNFSVYQTQNPLIGTKSSKSGLNMMDFTGTNKSLVNNAIPMPTTYSIFAVGYTKIGNWPNSLLRGMTDSIYCINARDANGIFNTLVGGGAWNDGASTNTPNISVYSSDETNQLFIMEMLNNGTSAGLTPFVNGIAQDVRNGTTVATNGMYIGGQAGYNQPWNGYIAEIIIYNNVLPTGARQLIEGYLAAKWGLQSQLPTTHPYYSAQPNMYFPQLPLWWYKYLASDISYSSPTSTFVAYNYGTQQFDGSMNGWAVTGPTDGLAIDNAANLGVVGSALRFGNGTPYMDVTNSNTQWMQWPTLNSSVNYYTLAFVLKYVDTTTPNRYKLQWTLNSTPTNTDALISQITDYGTNQIWQNNGINSFFYTNNVYDGNPHHFAFIFGPSNFQPQIYLDASALLVPSTLTAPYNTITSNILGFNFRNWGGNRYIDAWLGETRLYNFAMTPTQVNTLYNLMMDYTVPQPPITITGVTAVAGNVYSTGTSTTNGVQYAVYVFTSSTTNPAAPQYTINYNCSTATQCFVLAVAGGGGGGGFAGGGGGGGGVVMTPVNLSTGSGSITVAVGAGSPGTTTSTIGPSGYNTVVNFSGSTISNITAIGGGAGGGNLAGFDSGNAITSGSGASSGGGGYWGGFNGSSVGTSSNVGINYGNTSGIICGGGGGAGTAGTTGTKITGGGYGGNGGSGIQCFLPGIKDYTITSTVTNYTYLVSNLYWGGGGGGSSVNSYGTNMCMGGVGGGGGGANHATSGSGYSPGGAGLNTGQNGQILDANGGNGGINTGGGGGGGGNSGIGVGGTGGSGIVIIAFPQTAPVTALTNSVLTNPNLSTSAYNSLCGAFACNLVNYNYYGPMMTLRAPVDTNGQYTQNFYADTYGNMGTGYMGTGTSFSSWIKNPIGIQNINGCVIWLDAASSSSITTISNKVSQWVDKTSNAFTFTQSTDGNRPAYVANSLNGLPTLQFTASNSTFLGGPTNFAVGTNSFSLFAVCKFNDTTSPGSIFNKSKFGDATGRIVMLRDLNDISLNILVTDSTNSNFKIKETYPANKYRILELVYNRTAGTCAVYNNGTLLNSIPTTDTSNLTNTYNMIIGGYNDGNGNIITPQPGLYLDGNIAEIVAFSNPYDMTDGTRQQIEGYLANKWGLQIMLPANHPALNTSYAYVTKWYDQGMDFSFNCATQYNTGSQPIYDVSFKLLNFGYQGLGGGVVAPQTNCHFNLPDYSVPYGDGSYTIVLKHYNITNNVTFFHGGNFNTNYMNEFRWDGGNYTAGWFGNAVGGAYNLYYPNNYTNNVAVSKYTIGDVGLRYIYVNGIGYSGGAGSGTRTQDPSPNWIGLGSSGNSQFQMYYMYIFGTALSDQDRTIVENVNYYNSVNNIISDTNLIMYYPMESGDISNGYLANWAFGSPIYDASMVNSPTLVSNSRIVGGSAMAFTSNSAYLKLPDFTPTTNGLTFSCWINVNGSTGVSSRIFDIGLGQSSSNILIGFNTSNSLYFHCYYNNSQSDKQINIPISYTNNWVHIVWTLPYATAGTLTSNWIMYVNGSVADNTYTGYYPDPSITRTLNYIAKSNWSVDPSYNGYIDDFRVYNRVLSASEVSQLYYAQGWNYIPKQILTIKNSVSLVSTYLLTMYYPMEPADISGGTYLANWALGTPIYDVSLVNAPTISTNSRIVGGSSMLFSAASSQYLRLPNFTPTNNGLTFSCWINVNGSTGDNSRIFDFGNGAPSNNILIAFNPSNVLSFNCFYSVTQSNKEITIPTSYTNNWVHIAWTLTYVSPDSKTSNWIIYANGSIAGIYSGYYPDPSITRTKNYIGKSNWVDPYYNGYIDDFRVYNRVLTPTEVQTLYYTQGSNYIPQYVNLYYNSVSTISTTGLVMYYPLEATDSSGGYLANWALGTPIYDASMVNSPTTSTDMKVVGSSAMRFISANSQYLTLPNFTPTNNGLTFSFWINSNNSTTYATIFDFGHQFTNTNNIVCAVNNNSILAIYSYLGTDISNAYDLGPYNTSYWPSTIIPDITARWIWIAPVPYSRSMYPQARFIKTFTSATSYTGILYYAIDDWGDIYMNGQRLISFTGGGYTGTILTISINVVVGTNTLTINLCNSGGGPAGLIAALYDNNSNLVLHTDSTWNFYKYYTTYTSNDGYSTTLTKNINDNTWHHVVWSMSVADSNYSTTWNIYVDASNVYSNTFLNSNGYRYPYSYTMFNNYISGTVDSTNINNALFAYNNGYIDDFRVYNRVLNTAEVQTLYAAQGANYIPQYVNLYYNSKSVISTTGLVMYYPMELTDSSYGYLANWAFNTPIYDAQIVNNPTYSTDMKVAGTAAMKFTASSSQYLRLPNFTPTTNGLTFSIWYNSMNTGPNGRIFELGVGKTHNIIITPNDDTNKGILAVAITNSSGSVTALPLSDISYNDSTWRHVVWTLTYDISSSPTSIWNVYINGQSKNYTTSAYYPDTTIIRTTNYIGKSNWTDSSFNGYIDDFRLYNRILSPTEIQTLYNSQGANYIPQQSALSTQNSISTVSTYLLTMYYPMEPTDVNGTNLANWALGTPIYDASLVNAPILSTNSRKVGGSSMQFSAASSQYLQLQNFTPTNNGLTFSVWYNSVNTGRYGRIFEFGTDVANASSIVISSNSNNTNYLDFELFGKTSVLNYIILDDSNYNDGKWRHIVWTLSYDISSNPGSKWNIYVNGILHPKSITNGFYPDTTVTRTYNYIGKSTNSADAYYNGYIDDFRVYNRVLTPTEVQTLYYSQGTNYIPQNVNLYYNSVSTISTTGLVMYYPLESTDTSGGYLANWALGTPIYDASMVNSPTTSTDMKVVGSSAMRFISANSQYVRLPNFTPTTNGLTFSVWYNSINTGILSTIFSFGDGLDNRNIFISPNADDGLNKMRLNVHNSNTNQYYTLLQDANYNDGVWRHIVWTLTYDISSSQNSVWKIYVNGSLNKTETTGYYPDTSKTATTTYIGQNIWNQPYYNGYIDDFRVYNRVLSASEVQTLYYSQGSNYIPQTLNTFVSGLKYNSYTNNTGAYPFYWINPGHTNFDNSLTFFKKAGIPAYSGTITYIDINNSSTTPTTLCGLSFYNSGGSFYPQYSAIQFTGYFYAPTTGTYTFSLGDITSYKSNDDISVFWIGTAGTSIYNFLSTVTESGTAAPNGTGPSYQVTYNTSGSSGNFSNCQYSISLTAGKYYPIILSWGQSFGSAVLGLGITPPGGSITYDGTGYFYSSP